MTEQQLPDEQGMDAAFRARMRQGLSSMAVRERIRERRRNRAIAGGALAAVVVATAAVFGVQALAGADGQRDHAAPPAATSEAPVPTPTPHPTPEPTETEATPPPGLEGVAAGEAVATETQEGGLGDSGAAGGPDPSQIEGYIDSYVLCEGSGRVFSGDQLWVDCGALQPGTVIADIGSAQYREWDDPELTWSEDFDGEVRVVPHGESPEGTGIGGTATIYVECLYQQPMTIGGVRFECMEAVQSGSGPTRLVTAMAAWGVPFGPDELVPRVEVDAGSGGELGTARGTIRFVIER